MLSLCRRLGPVLVFLLFAPLASASISLPLPWKQGMELRYRVQVSEDSQRPDRKRTATTSSTQHLLIREANDKGFLQVWTSTDEKTEVSGNAEDVESTRRLGRELSQRFAGLSVEAELEADGSFRRVRNWQAYATAMREVMLPALLEQNGDKIKAAKADEAALRERLMPLLDKLTGEQAVSTIVGKQVQILNFFTAPNLPAGKAVDYEDYLPSPWSADLIPTKGSFRLDEVSTERVTIHWTQGIDPDKGAQVMWKIMESILGAGFTEEEKKQLPTSMDIRDQATAVLDRRTGVPLRIEYTRQIKAGEMLKSTRIVMEKLP